MKKDARITILQHLREIPTLERDGYPYALLPFDFGFTPDFLAAVTRLMVESFLNASIKRRVRALFTIEAKGLPLATALALELGVPVHVGRKREYGCSGECEVVKHTGYETSRIYINGLAPGSRGLLVVDDIISTGGTLRAVLDWARARDVEVLAAWSVFHKTSPSPEPAGIQQLRQTFDVPVKSLLKLRLVPGEGKYKATFTPDSMEARQ